jgi:protein-tyrosine phosphatase
MQKILCVCVGNISRSPMMQAVLQQHLGDAFLVESAGLTRELAGRPANHRSVACMYERGVDLSAHVSRWVGDLDLSQYQWIVCVGHDEAEQVRSLFSADETRVIVANELRGGIPDPYEHGLVGYRDCLALLDEVMPHVALQISQAQSANADGPTRLLGREH